jgi:hypothetical protein
MLAIAGVTVPIASADIYFWTDENGVKNFTNYSPPEKAEVFMETPEADEDTVFNEAETDRPATRTGHWNPSNCSRLLRRSKPFVSR